MRENRRLGWTLAAVGMLLVSTDSLFVRLAEADGWNIAFLVAACSLPIHLALNHRYEQASPGQALRAHTAPLVAVAVLAAVSQISFITALTKTDVSNVVVIVAASPLMAAVVARVGIGERTSRRVWIAIGMTVVGIMVVVGSSLDGPKLGGDLLALVAVAAFAINMTIWRQHPVMSRFVGLALSAVITMAVTAAFVSPFDLETRTYLAVAAMGFLFNPLGRIAHTNAPRYAPAAEVALFTPIETVAASLWAWLAFSEQPTGSTLVGGAIVIAGVLFGTFSRLGETSVRRPTFSRLR